MKFAAQSTAHTEPYSEYGEGALLIATMKFADCIDSAKTEKTALHDIRPTSCLVLIIKGTYVKTAYCIRMLDVKV
jgi:hypothetical protein